MPLNVTLISHTPLPEKTIAAAAKLCYSPATIDNIMDDLTEDKTSYFVNMLADMGHESPMEHANFTFGIEGISRACSHQLVRHRIASFSQQSQRYVNGTSFSYVVPPQIAKDENALSEYNKAIELQFKSYSDVRRVLLLNQIKEHLQVENVENEEIFINDFKLADKANFSKFEKIANEDARFLLPNACETSLVMTMNVRSLFNFFAHRCCNRAQWEIRALALEMYKLCIKTAPNVFKNSGASCVNAPCPEGKMSCKKQTEVREYFKNLKVDL